MRACVNTHISYPSVLTQNTQRGNICQSSTYESKKNEIQSQFIVKQIVQKSKKANLISIETV